MCRLTRSDLVFLALGLFLVIVVGREYGLADNGDFSRYMCPYVDRPVGFDVNWPPVGSTDYRRRFFDEPIFYWHPAGDGGCSPWFSSAHLFWRVGKEFSRLAFGTAVVDARLVYAPVFVAHLLLLLFALISCRRIGSSAVARLLAVALFSDAMVMAFYNSFYAESVGILGVFAAFAVCLWSQGSPAQEGPSPAQVLFALLPIAAMIALAKRQYLYLVPGFLLLACLGWLLASGATARRQTLAVAGVGIVAMVGVVFAGVGQREGGEEHAIRQTSFHSLYYGVLMFSDDKPALLGKLQLPESSTPLIGLNAFGPETGRFIGETFKLSPALFAKAVSAEPKAFLRLLAHNASELGNIRIDLGAIPSGQHQAPPRRLSPVTSVGERLAGWPFLALAGAAALFLLVGALRRTPVRNPGLALAVLFLAMIVPLDLLTSSFDGIQEARKHLILSSCAGYALCTLAAMRLLDAAADWARSLRLHRDTR